MKKQKTNNKGITLIALVVTIVVLLILAGISISMLTGESGIIAHAQQSKLQNEIGKEKEYIKLAFSSVKAEKISRGDTSDVTSTELQEEINNYTNEATVTGTGILKITYTSGREYEVDGTGKITSTGSNGEGSIDEMYSEEGVEGEIAPEDLFEYEIINQQSKTARIVRIKPEYCNLDGYNPHTDSFDLTDTYGDIIYKSETISELLVIPYEATINGTKYKITEANISAVRKYFYMGTTTYYMGLPNVKWIVYPNTIEKMECYISSEIEQIFYSIDYNASTMVEKITFSSNIKAIDSRILNNTQWYNNQPTEEDIYIEKLLYEYRGGRESTSVTIKEGTIGIASGVFNYYYNITSIIIPDSVTYIGAGAFENCSGLTSITIPEGVKSIGDNAFRECSNLTNVTISEGVTSIRDFAFYECENLTSITLPDSVTSIGRCAFSGCTNLTDITIPDGVTNVGGWAFSGTKWLENQPQEDVYIGKIFYACWDGLSTNVSIREGTTQIAEGAFAGCSITSVTIPDSVTSIGFEAFWRCSNLASITIPNSVTKIGQEAFAYCENLTSITIPDSVTSIGQEAFLECASLTSITLPDSITSMGGYQTFAYCENLTSITIPKGTTNIGPSMFEGCSSLANVMIPNGVKMISYQAFSNCRNLTSIIIPDSVTCIDSNAFEHCESLISITIPNSVTSIGTGAFDDCGNLTSITIPESVTYISSGAFYRCNNLTSINIKKEQDSLENSPWGASNATVNWNYTGE